MPPSRCVLSADPAGISNTHFTPELKKQDDVCSMPAPKLGTVHTFLLIPPVSLCRSLQWMAAETTRMRESKSCSCVPQVRLCGQPLPRSPTLTHWESTFPHPIEVHSSLGGCSRQGLFVDLFEVKLESLTGHVAERYNPRPKYFNPSIPRITLRLPCSAFSLGHAHTRTRAHARTLLGHLHAQTRAHSTQGETATKACKRKSGQSVKVHDWEKPCTAKLSHPASGQILP